MAKKALAALSIGMIATGAALTIAFGTGQQAQADNTFGAGTGAGSTVTQSAAPTALGAGSTVTQSAAPTTLGTPSAAPTVKATPFAGGQGNGHSDNQ